MIPYYNNYFMLYPFLPPNCNLPPTIYTILESIVNPDVNLNNPAPEVKIKDLAEEGRKKIFDFDYPLSNNVPRKTFETMILNHFLQRRIGFETVTAFKIQLNVKLNTIMPLYNKMFNALENWDIFLDGETTVRTGTDNRTTENINNTSNTLINKSNTTNTDVADLRNSELPQNQLENLRDGSYVTNYNYNTNTSSANDSSESAGNSNAINNVTDKTEYVETIKRSPADKITILKEMQENINNIYTLIFKDLDCLFYQLA